MKLSEIAYHDFKKALLSRKIVPGDTMTQASLAKILKTQISPLRIAMHRLETEGLVKILPRSGIHIVKPDLSVIRDSYSNLRPCPSWSIGSILLHQLSVDPAQINSGHFGTARQDRNVLRQGAAIAGFFQVIGNRLMDRLERQLPPFRTATGTDHVNAKAGAHRIGA